MTFTKTQLWQRFQKHYLDLPSIGMAIDVSRVSFPDNFFATIQPKMQRAFAEMDALERGAIANPDEKRMVGHYWLRNPALAPTPQIKADIENTLAAVKRFARDVHDGTIQGERGKFKNVLLIGIGGSALGPQFVANALGQPGRDKMRMFFFDNTDPDGMDKVLASIKGELGETLCIVISKSGGTKETRNGMLEAASAYNKAGLQFNTHVVAITQIGSALDKQAIEQQWIARFPMWDWVGGRTSETSAVGLLPAALQGLSIDQLLAGARDCDTLTRNTNVTANPAALLAAMWLHSGNAKGEKDMVVIPYKDRLELFSKYLQQLIMESLGKELDRNGKIVNQGIAVYGNKGSTDQHAYVQQLREGVHNFFVTFINVLKDRDEASLEVEPRVTSGDFLNGFLLGTRQALIEKGRESITITIAEVSPRTVGALIALFERAVGLYASLVNINAYHQPGVEAGKKAAGVVIDLQLKVLDALRKSGPLSIADLAKQIGAPEEQETIFWICEHLAANQTRRLTKLPGTTAFESKYSLA